MLENFYISRFKLHSRHIWCAWTSLTLEIVKTLWCTIWSASRKSNRNKGRGITGTQRIVASLNHKSWPFDCQRSVNQKNCELYNDAPFYFNISLREISHWCQKLQRKKFEKPYPLSIFVLITLHSASFRFWRWQIQWDFEYNLFSFVGQKDNWMKYISDCQRYNDVKMRTCSSSVSPVLKMVSLGIMCDCRDWLHESWTPRCNTQLQTSCSKPKRQYPIFFFYSFTLTAIFQPM